jgi:glucose/arabinose dehydrogenase
MAWIAALATLVGTPITAQTTNQPFPSPIDAESNIITVDVIEFATVPDIGGAPARIMLLVTEPGTRRMFVNDMTGPLYSVSYDGRTVAEYINIDDPRWGVAVQSSGRERGFQSFAFHPDFGRQGSPGYGRFYTWTDTENNHARADFVPGGGTNTHHTVLLEWSARDAAAPAYDGGPPREILRFEQPFANHNAGHLAFHSTATSGDAEYGLLYIGVADGGSGGDPLSLAQNPASAFGKILRIDPLATNSRNGQYGIPARNPYAGVMDSSRLGEIYALGMRNPQRFGWDPANGTMYMADIGQNIVEELSIVTPGANLGWNVWEGSFRFVSREGVDASNPRGDPAFVYPVAEYAHGDPLILQRAAATGVHVYRSDAIPQLRNRVLFGDFPSGEIFHFDADNPPNGGNRGFHRVLLRRNGEAKTFLQLIQEKNREQGRELASRADLRFGAGPDGQVLLLNKADGTIRLLVPGN